MSRNTTLSPAWTALIDRVGGLAQLCDSLGMAQTTFYRASRGLVAFAEDKRTAISILSELYELPNPLEGQPLQPRVKDLAPLRMLGDAMAQGFPPATRVLERLRRMYPTSQLVELAESDNTPENILRGVAKLLEAD